MAFQILNKNGYAHLAHARMATGRFAVNDAVLHELYASRQRPEPVSNASSDLGGTSAYPSQSSVSPFAPTDAAATNAAAAINTSYSARWNAMIKSWAAKLLLAQPTAATVPPTARGTFEFPIVVEVKQPPRGFLSLLPGLLTLGVTGAFIYFILWPAYQSTCLREQSCGLFPVDSFALSLSLSLSLSLVLSCSL